MDLEKLTKHQIILLTLLVSFVTSIATGIVTVSLMQQAPPSVSRTINQIVEHTVETIAPNPQGAAAVTTTKTVVVKDEDQVASAIAALQKSIIRITAKGSDDLLARGVIIGKGEALTDKAALAASGADSFDAILPGGVRVPVVVEAVKSTSTPFALLALPESTSTSYAPATLADLSKVQLGQSVIRIGGNGVDTVGIGVVAMLPSGSDDVEASVQSSTPGSILTNRFGEVIGMTTSASLSTAADLYTAIAVPQAKPQETKPVN